MPKQSPWKANDTWTRNLPRKGVDHAHDANGQQLPQASTDATSLLFPAFGAILILLFGGFLLSSGNSCCPMESSSKKKNDEEYEGIGLEFLDIVHFPKPLPVLQQENNDVVDAVMETYCDLPQYAPVSELMASIPGIVRRPETRDACVSPIAFIDQEKLFPGDKDHAHGSQCNLQEAQNIQEPVKKDNENHDPSTYEEESNNINSEQINNGQSVEESSTCSNVSQSSGFGTCSRVNTPAISTDSGIQGGNMGNKLIPVKKHPQEIRRDLSASFGFEQETDHNPLNDSFSHEGTPPNKHCTPLTRFKLHKWIKNTMQSRDIEPQQNGSSMPYQWKRPAKLTKQEKLEILRKLQPDLNATIFTGVNKTSTRSFTRKQENTRSCLEQRKLSECMVNAQGGRLSCLQIVRAPSSMCIHGNICRYNCKARYMTSERDDQQGGDDDSGHGASSLGISLKESAVTQRGASALVESNSNKNIFDLAARGASAFEGPLRGASAFDEATNQFNTVNGSNQDSRTGCNSQLRLSTHGASAFDKSFLKANISVDNNTELHTAKECMASNMNKKNYGQQTTVNRSDEDQTVDFRGASGIGQSYFDCLSVAGTASVTLSIAAHSEKEDITLTGIIPKQTNLTERQSMTEEKKNVIIDKANDESPPLSASQANFRVVLKSGNEEAHEFNRDEKIDPEKILAAKIDASSDGKLGLLQGVAKPKLDEKEDNDEHKLAIPRLDILPTVKEGLKNREGNKANEAMQKYEPPGSENISHMETNQRFIVFNSDNKSHVVCKDVKSRDTLNLKPDDVKSIDKEAPEFNPDRSSTPHKSNASTTENISKISHRTKGQISKENPREDCNNSNVVPGKNIRCKSTKMSLGKNPEALSGLLKALQRAKRKKDGIKEIDSNTDISCATEKDGVNTDQDCLTAIKSPTKSRGEVFSARTQSPEETVEKKKNVVGKLKVCLFYNTRAESPVLYVTVLRASSLEQKFATRNRDLYIRMHLSSREDKKQETKSIITLSNNAVFNHLFQVHDITLEELKVSTIKLILVSGHSQHEEAIAYVPLAGLVARDKIKKTYLLKKCSPQQNEVEQKNTTLQVPVGALHLGLKYNSVDEKLLVNVTKARGLPAMSETGETNPYVILTVKDGGRIIEEKVTCTTWNERNPQFDASFVLEITRKRIETSSLLLRVMNNAANHSLIGVANIGKESIEDSGRNHWECAISREGVYDEHWHKLFK